MLESVFQKVGAGFWIKNAAKTKMRAINFSLGASKNRSRTFLRSNWMPV